MPETDFEAKYEETDVPEDKFVKVEYLKDKFRYKLETAFPDEGLSGRFWMHVRGGYKLYNKKGAEDRWYFTLGLEAPSDLFVDGQVMYMWLKYTNGDETADDTGAIGCKITVGDQKQTKVDQWVGDVNMSSDSADVIGKKWYKQNKYGKLTEPEYMANWW